MTRRYLRWVAGVLLCGLAAGGCTSSTAATAFSDIGTETSQGIGADDLPVGHSYVYQLADVCTTGETKVHLTKVEPMMATGKIEVVDWGTRRVATDAIGQGPGDPDGQRNLTLPELSKLGMGPFTHNAFSQHCAATRAPTAHSLGFVKRFPYVRELDVELRASTRLARVRYFTVYYDEGRTFRVSASFAACAPGASKNHCDSLR